MGGGAVLAVGQRRLVCACHAVRHVTSVVAVHAEEMGRRGSRLVGAGWAGPCLVSSGSAAASLEIYIYHSVRYLVMQRIFELASHTPGNF